ncbi:putative two-component system sensor protein histidine kinase [Pedobacter sp. BAL39]|uniref:sensor histidine kinase n=1 Tax=Pedobacter sp. BAL39 TaxID=391596 RepID=UPI0001559E33|nr:histidine kinase [Pedobacter sp. BAL39]EDM35945.1 putative two-component system sensor protein histidine kinase [Pedobacter sp. BAL39]
MQEKLPLKRLIRLTWLQTIIIGFIFYLVASSTDNPLQHVITYTLLTMSGILLVGVSDILLMVVIARNTSIRSKKFSFLRRLLTYLVSIIIYLLLRPAFAYVGRVEWSFWDLSSFFAFVGSGIVINTLITLLHDSVLLYEHKMHSELELSRLKTANAEAMNLALKQQIHPHFLFNALNTLKALYHKDTQVADDYIVHMANFLRASIYHHNANVALLKDEVSLLTDYLEMQRIRFGAALDCTINLPPETLNNYYLPSFSLQPLLENAIKHNNFTLEDPLTVVISQNEDTLVISNNIQNKKMKVASTNYGLANLAERYRLWSGDEITIREDADLFTVSIKLLKDEHSNH